MIAFSLITLKLPDTPFKKETTTERTKTKHELTRTHCGSISEIVTKLQDYLEVGCEWGEGSGEKGCTRRAGERAWSNTIIIHTRTVYLFIEPTKMSKTMYIHDAKILIPQMPGNQTLTIKGRTEKQLNVGGYYSLFLTSRKLF